MGDEILMRLLTSSFAIATLLVTLLAQSMPASAEPLHDGLLGAVNAYRASRGLPTLAASPTLQAAAQFMAEDVASYGPPAIAHRSTDGRMPRQRMADASTLGESSGWLVPTRSAFAPVVDHPVEPVFVKATTHCTVCPADAVGNADSVLKVA